MHSQNHIGVKKAYIDSPFDDDEPEERKPFANLIEALGGPHEASMGREYPHFLSLLDPFESDEGQVSPAQLPTDVLQGIVDAYRNRRALGDERDRHLDMTNFMAEMTGMNPRGIARTRSGDTYALPSMSEEHGAQEYRDITDELGLRRDEIEEVRQNVPGLYQPLRIEDIHDLGDPVVPTINTPDDITLDDWLLPEEQELLLSEPMDMAWRLLKSHLDLLSADELFELAAIGTDDPDIVAHHLGERRLLTSEEAEEITWRAMEAHDAEGESSHPEGISHRENVKQYEEESGRNAHNWGYNVPEMQFGDKEVGAKPMIGPDRPSSLVGRRNYESPQIIGNMPWPQDFTTENKAEPMDIAYQLLKERVSPAAIRHKLEYDTNYESNPKRVKYREQLNQERRRRGIYGSGNQMDISHTQGNKLSLEGQHANRARHFKNRGTLRRVRVR